MLPNRFAAQPLRVHRAESALSQRALRPATGTRLAPDLRMAEKHVLIIGGGLAGLSAGCYAQASGFPTTARRAQSVARRGLHGVEARRVSRGRLYPLADRRPVRAGLPRAGDRARGRAPHARALRDLSPRARRHRSRLHPRPRQAFAATSSTSLPATGRRSTASSPARGKSPRSIRASITRRSSHRSATPFRSCGSTRHEFGTLLHFRKPLEQWVHEHVKSPRLARSSTNLRRPKRRRCSC